MIGKWKDQISEKIRKKDINAITSCLSEVNLNMQKSYSVTQWFIFNMQAITFTFAWHGTLRGIQEGVMRTIS